MGREKRRFTLPACFLHHHYIFLNIISQTAMVFGNLTPFLAQILRFAHPTIFVSFSVSLSEGKREENR